MATVTKPPSVDWKRYIGDDGVARAGARELFRDELLRLEDGRLLGEALETWQREKILGPIDARNDDGTPVHKLIDIELHRGGGKTTVVSAVVLGELVLGGLDRRVFAFASDEDQARLLRDAAAGFIRRNPALESLFTVERTLIRCRVTGSELRIMSGDAPSAYGLTPDLVVVDEIAQFKNRELWDSIFSASVKKRSCQVVVISTPGWSRSSIAWEVHEAARQEEGYYLWSPGERVAGWLDVAEIERQRRTDPPHVFRRLHLGQWTEGEGAFITLADLVRCVRPELRPVLACSEGSHVLAIDLGLSVDRTAAAVLHRTATGVRLDLMRVWEGTRETPVSITGEVEPFMAHCVANFTNLGIVMDTWNARSTSERFHAIGVPIMEFVFTTGGTSRINELTRNLYALFAAGQIELYEDHELERELLDVQVIEKSYGLRIDHRSGHHDDRVIALGMGAWSVMQMVRVATFDETEFLELGQVHISPF